MDAGYTGEGKGADWVERTLGWTTQIVRHPPKLAPEEVMRRWVEEWDKEEVWRSAPAVGGGAHLLLVGTEPPYEQGLRTVTREERGVRLRGDESLDGEAFSSLMRLFRLTKRCCELLLAWPRSDREQRVPRRVKSSRLLERMGN